MSGIAPEAEAAGSRHHTRQAITEARDRFITSHGPWTGHRIDLGHGVYTCEDVPAYGLAYRTTQYLEILSEFGFPDLNGAWILDLGCMEGAFSIEFARRGANVVGIDGRAANVAHARFAASILNLESRCRFLVEDVRNLHQGRFDIVLCAGLLYHLTAADAVALVRRIGLATLNLTLINTHVAPAIISKESARFNLSGIEEVEVEGKPCRGRWYQEFPDNLSQQARLAYSTGSSLDNNRSFWFEAPDLRRIVGEAGFEVHQAFYDNDFRIVLAGKK